MRRSGSVYLRRRWPSQPVTRGDPWRLGAGPVRQRCSWCLEAVVRGGRGGVMLVSIAAVPAASADMLARTRSESRLAGLVGLPVVAFGVGDAGKVLGAERPGRHELA